MSNHTKNQPTTLPHDVEAEQGVLGALILDPARMNSVNLEAADFFDDANEIVFTAMRQLHGEGKPLDQTLLRDRLQDTTVRGDMSALDAVGGLPYLFKITSAAPNVAHVNYHADVIRSHAVKRRVWQFGNDIIRRSCNGSDPSELLQFISEGVQQLECGTDRAQPRCFTISELADEFPSLRKPVVYGLLRRGETMNLIASPKAGKSWMANDLAITVATGGKWLDTFDTEQSEVLVIDNELHPQTISDRARRVADARDVPIDQLADKVRYVPLRGRLTDLYQLGRVLEWHTTDETVLVILDAFYRFLPGGVDENSNSEIAQLYNTLDAYAAKFDVSFVCIHHSTKGSQAAKSVTDVGAGAGSQSRAADVHAIIRPHVEKGAFVLEAATRSWPPIPPIALRWKWPIWTLADDLDPTKLHGAKEVATEDDKVQAVKNDILKAFVHFPDGATKTRIQKQTGRPNRWGKAMQQLIDSGDVVECDILSKSHDKPDAGYKRVYSDE